MGAVLTLAAYPGIDTAEIGQRANTGYGKADGVRAHLVSGGATALISADIAINATSVTLDSASRFPSAPFTMQVGAELMRVTAKSGTTFTVTRAYGGTSAFPHKKGRTAFEVRTEYVWLVADHAVKSIAEVFVDSVRQSAGFTAYTGQSGDAHPGYPGKAVIAFTAEAAATRQYNLTDAESQAKVAGIPLAAEAGYTSSPALTDGSDGSYAALGGATSAQMHFAHFGASSEAVVSQSYHCRVKNPGDTDRTLWLKVGKNGALIDRRSFVIRPGQTALLTHTRNSGADTDDRVFVHADGLMHLYSISKTLHVLPGIPAEELNERAAAESIVSVRAGDPMGSAGRYLALRTYDTEASGTLVSQRHYAEVTELGGEAPARVRLVAEGNGFVEREVAPGDTITLTHEHSGGSINAETRLVVLKGSVRLDALGKTLMEAHGRTETAPEPAASATARIVVGEELRVNAEWAVDEDGTYGGIGTLIERPDHVIKHFITSAMGFSLSEVDAASFSAAGSAYASAISGGYKFSLVFSERASAATFVRRLAMECRSTLVYANGLWRLTYMPDEAPAPLCTITVDDLAGRGSDFVFSRSLPEDLGNRLLLRYQRIYSQEGAEYAAVAVAEDAASINLYGPHPRRMTFDAVRDEAMAAHVLEHLLRVRKAPSLIVEFPVFHGQLDLAPGQAVSIVSALHGEGLYVVEEVRRTDRFRALVRARRWWES